MYFNLFQTFKTKLLPLLPCSSDNKSVLQLTTAFYMLSCLQQLQNPMHSYDNNQLQLKLNINDEQLAVLVENCMEIFQDKYNQASPDDMLIAIYQYYHDNDASIDELLTNTYAIIDEYMTEKSLINKIYPGGLDC